MQTRTDRDPLIDAFLARHGWGDARRVALAGDASFRHYHRVFLPDRQAVLMDAPPGLEDVRPFLRVGNHLNALGLSAPQVLASDPGQGFLLLEDLGDHLFTRFLQRHPGREKELYIAATDVLVELYGASAAACESGIEPYDTAKLMRECALFSDWFLPAMMPKAEAERLGREYVALWTQLLALLPAEHRLLVLRDYHADNLLWLEDREGVRRVGLLDFQDAVIGHAAYDMVSFLEDARRDVAADTVQASIDHFLGSVPIDHDAFHAAYALLGAQRNCKIIGIFLRFCLRDGKRNYLHYLPRVWRHLETDLRHPLLSSLARWMDAHIPLDWRGVPKLGASAAVSA